MWYNGNMGSLPWDEETWGNPFDDFVQFLDIKPGSLLKVVKATYWLHDSCSWDAIGLPVNDFVLFVGFSVVAEEAVFNIMEDAAIEERTSNVTEKPLKDWPVMIFLWQEKVLLWVFRPEHQDKITKQDKLLVYVANDFIKVA